MAKNRFRSGSGVITCAKCGCKTRDTGHMEENFDMCRFCLEKWEQENCLLDGVITKEEYEKIIADIEIQRVKHFGK